MKFEFLELDRPGKKVTKQITSFIVFNDDSIEFSNKYEACFYDENLTTEEVAVSMEDGLELVEYIFVALRHSIVGIDWGWDRDKHWYDVELYLTNMENLKIQYIKKKDAFALFEYGKKYILKKEK